MTGLGEFIKGKNNLEQVPNNSKLRWILCGKLQTAFLVEIPQQTILVLHISWRCLEDVFSVTIFHSLRRVCKRSPSKTSSRRFYKAFSRRFCKSLEDVMENEKMLPWRRLQHLFNTSLPRRMFAGTFDLKRLHYERPITFPIIDIQWSFFLKWKINLIHPR